MVFMCIISFFVVLCVLCVLYDLVFVPYPAVWFLPLFSSLFFAGVLCPVSTVFLFLCFGHTDIICGLISFFFFFYRNDDRGRATTADVAGSVSIADLAPRPDARVRLKKMLIALVSNIVACAMQVAEVSAEPPTMVVLSVVVDVIVGYAVAIIGTRAAAYERECFLLVSVGWSDKTIIGPRFGPWCVFVTVGRANERTLQATRKRPYYVVAVHINEIQGLAFAGINSHVGQFSSVQIISDQTRSPFHDVGLAGQIYA